MVEKNVRTENVMVMPVRSVHTPEEVMMVEKKDRTENAMVIPERNVHTPEEVTMVEKNVRTENVRKDSVMIARNPLH